jgi:hypothetical protein
VVTHFEPQPAGEVNASARPCAHGGKHAVQVRPLKACEGTSSRFKRIHQKPAGDSAREGYERAPLEPPSPGQRLFPKRSQKSAKGILIISCGSRQPGDGGGGFRVKLLELWQDIEPEPVPGVAQGAVRRVCTRPDAAGFTVRDCICMAHAQQRPADAQ